MATTLAAPDSIVRAIFAAAPSAARESVLSALGLSPTGEPVSVDQRDAAAARLRAATDAGDAVQPALYDEAEPRETVYLPLDDMTSDEIPF